MKSRVKNHFFLKTDKDDSGSIEIEEFFSMLGCKRDLFGDYLFQLIDVNHDGGLDFEEFVLGVVTFSSSELAWRTRKR